MGYLNQETREVCICSSNAQESLTEWMLWSIRRRQKKNSMAFIQGAMQQALQNNGFQAGIWSHGELVGIIGTHQIHWINRRFPLAIGSGKAIKEKAS